MAKQLHLYFLFTVLSIVGLIPHIFGQSDTIIAKEYLSLAEKFSNINADSSLNYHYKAETIFIKNKLWVEYGKSILTSFDVISDNELYSEGLKRFKQAEKLLSSNLDTNHIYLARLYNNGSIMYFRLNKFEQAMFYAQKGLNIAEFNKKKYPEVLVKIYTVVGALYSEPYRFSKNDSLDSDIAKAIISYRKAIDISYSINNKHNDITTLCWRNIAVCYRIQGNNAKALETINKCIEIFKTEQISNLDLGSAYNTKGKIYFDMGKYSEALIANEEALELRKKYLPIGHTDIAESLNNMGASYQMIGKYTDAETYYKQAISIYEDKVKDEKSNVNPIFIIFYKNYNLGSLYNSMGKYKEAKELLQVAIDTLSLEKWKDNYVLLLARSFKAMADVHFELGDYEQSKEYHEESLRLRMEYFGEINIETPVSYQDLANVLVELKEYDEAKKNYDRAISIFNQIYPDGSIYTGSVYCGLANIYQKDKNYIKANEYYDKAYKMLTETTGVTNQFNSQIFTGKGNIAINQNDYVAAINYFEKALESNKIIRGTLHAKTLDSFFNLGKIYEQQEQVEKALEIYETAIKLISKDDASFFRKENIVDLNAKEQVLQLINAKSSILVELYNNDNTDIQYLISSLKYDLFSIKFIEIILKEHFSNTFKIGLRTKYQLVYNRAIETLDLLRNDTNNINPNYSELYLELVERSKFSSLRQDKDLDAELTSGVVEKSKSAFHRQELYEIEANKSLGNQNIVDTIKSLQQQILRHQDIIDELESNNQTLSENDEQRLKNFKEALLEKRRELERTFLTLKETNPNYYNIKYNDEVVSISEIQNKILPSNMAFFQYKVTDKCIFLQVITISEVKYYKFEVNENLESFIKHKFRKSLADKKFIKKGEAFGLYLQYANELYQKIIKKAIDDLDASITRLKISPDAYLWFVNFDVLITDARDFNNQVSPRRASYLLRRYAISYAYSATVLSYHLENNERKNPLIGLFVPTYIRKVHNQNKNITNSFLTFLQEIRTEFLSLEEPDSLRNLFNLPDGQCYVGSDVTDDLIKTEIKFYDIVYIRSHGWVDTQKASRSGLVFSNVDTLRNGILDIGDIYTLDIKANFIYLSACETAYSLEQINGESLVSISQSFASRGCASMVAGMWKSNVGTSKIITLYFFEELLKNGLPTDVAMQKAKLLFLETENDSRLQPYFWAVYVPIGNSISYSK